MLIAIAGTQLLFLIWHQQSTAVLDTILHPSTRIALLLAPHNKSMLFTVLYRNVVHQQGCLMRRVLIVDDHAIVRGMVCSVFKSKGFEVYAAQNGAEAIQKAQDENPDLIVLDLVMPVMNGLEAARALKILRPAIPLLMFTNNIGGVMEQEARSAGISAVVSKSESLNNLLARANQLLN